ncbi:transporter [uncultured Polaribacter sp.]|uniref:transporter n=1 Tax=uncultured Polaribacter sp. TaxID=174711 RepID=UPI00262BA8C0|nr:transporter [uncultured Polaribacter sp.]
MKPFFLKLLFVFFLLKITAIQAQYTDVINSNKPGLSESPYAVGLGVYQVESNFFLRNTDTKTTFSNPQSYGADLLFRTSFLREKLEFNGQLIYQRDQFAFDNVFKSEQSASGVSKFSLGAKYLLYQPTYTDKSKEVRSWKRRNAFDKKRLLPSIAIYGGLNTGFVNEVYVQGGLSPKAGILLQQNLSRDFNVISNVFYDRIGTNFEEISYIITATQNFGSRWSGFLEHQGIFQEHQNNANIGAGLAYLFSKDFQINTSARFILEGINPGFVLGFGVSYRIDKHDDGYSKSKEKKQKGQKYKGKDSAMDAYYKKENSFLNRLMNLFRRK